MERNEKVKIAISENDKILYFTGYIKKRSENFITIETIRNETIEVNIKSVIWIKQQSETVRNDERRR